MKTQVILFFVCSLLSTITYGQNESNISQPMSINTTGALPDSSAILDASANDRGVLIPRMSTIDRMAIVNPALGLMVYDTSLNQPCHYTDSQWVCLPSCVTLDFAYDCGGPGFGRIVTVDTGAVELQGFSMFDPTLIATAASFSPTVIVDQNGPGDIATFRQNNPFSMNSGITLDHMGLGIGMQMITSNPMNMSTTLDAFQLGVGSVASFTSANPMNNDPTVIAMNFGAGDGVHGISMNPDSCFLAGVKGTGGGNAKSAAALNAHDGAIVVTKTNSPNTPAEVFDTVLTSWLPMEDCPSSCGGSMPGTDTYAWNSDIITIPNVYVDPNKSVIMHTTQVPSPYFLRAVTRNVFMGGFSVQFVLDMDQCTALCAPPPELPIRLHYVIINRG